MLPTTNTSAESFQSNELVQFTFNPTISLNISGDLTIESLTPGDAKDSNIITVTAESNAIAGYTVSSTVGSSTNASTELRKGGTDTTNKFTHLTSNKASLTDFDDSSSTWGYSYSTDSGTTWQSGDITVTDPSSPLYPTVGYNGLPLYTTESPIKLINSNTNGTSSIQFKIGAKSTATQIAGEYTNVVNFISVAKPNPIIPTDLTNTTWRLNEILDLAPIMPTTGYKNYYINFPMKLTVEDFMENIGASEYGITTWLQAIYLIPDFLQAYGATDIASTVEITDENGNYLVVNYTSLYTQQITPDNLYYMHDSVSHFPASTGEITFTLDEEQYSFSLVEFIQYFFLGGSLSEPYFNGVWTETFYNTITITGGTDATNPTLIQWLVNNATQL